MGPPVNYYTAGQVTADRWLSWGFKQPFYERGLPWDFCLPLGEPVLNGTAVIHASLCSRVNQFLRTLLESLSPPPFAFSIFDAERAIRDVIIFYRIIPRIEIFMLYYYSRDLLHVYKLNAEIWQHGTV